MSIIKTKIEDFLTEMTHKDMTPADLTSEIDKMLKEVSDMENDTKNNHKWDIKFKGNEINAARISFLRKTKEPFIWNLSEVPGKKPEDIIGKRYYYKDNDIIRVGNVEFKWVGDGEKGRAERT